MKVITIKAEAFERLKARIKELENQYTRLCDELARDRLYDSREVGRMLSVSTATLQNLRDSGKLPHTKVGRTIRYRWSDLEKLLASK